MKGSQTKAPIIRPMEISDVPEAARLEEETFSMPWKESDFIEMIEAPYAHFYVADHDGRIVGIIGLRDLSGEGEITNVAVNNDFKRRGIGSLLVSKVIEESTKFGIGDLTLEVRASNEAAIRLYDKFGFKSEGIRPGFYEKPVEDALILWRRTGLC